MKYIRRYLTTNLYNEDKPNIQNLDFAVSQDVESNKVYLHKLNRIVSPSESLPCDICLYDKTADKLIIVKGDLFSIDYFPADKYAPIGIVVVPGSHNVYGDGSCGVMSLKEMNYTTPDNGSTSYQYMRWGGNDTDINTLTNYDQVCYVGSNGSVGENVIGINSYAYLPSDGFNAVANPYDTETDYHSSSNNYIPSPYKNDGTFNTEYFRISSPSSMSNAMSDFNGVGNTQIITDLATAQSDWKTASAVINNSGAGYYPAACCCWRYHTEGTNQGDWYLPACGELGYIIPRLNKIQKAIQKMITAYDSSIGVVLSMEKIYWSSSEKSNLGARYIRAKDGLVGFSSKGSNYYVRAFLRVGRNE